MVFGELAEACTNAVARPGAHRTVGTSRCPLLPRIPRPANASVQLLIPTAGSRPSRRRLNTWRRMHNVLHACLRCHVQVLACVWGLSLLSSSNTTRHTSTSSNHSLLQMRLIQNPRTPSPWRNGIQISRPCTVRPVLRGEVADGRHHQARLTARHSQERPQTHKMHGRQPASQKHKVPPTNPFVVVQTWSLQGSRRADLSTGPISGC